jgi:hypothetical protein
MMEVVKKDPSLHTESDKQMLADVENNASFASFTASKANVK